MPPQPYHRSPKINKGSKNFLFKTRFESISSSKYADLSDKYHKRNETT
jgi:hypothetical protein